MKTLKLPILFILAVILSLNASYAQYEKQVPIGKCIDKNGEVITVYGLFKKGDGPYNTLFVSLSKNYIVNNPAEDSAEIIISYGDVRIINNKQVKILKSQYGDFNTFLELPCVKAALVKLHNTVIKGSVQKKTIEIKVGKVEDDKYVITANMVELAKRFNTLLSQQNFSEKVSSIEIVKGTIVGTKNQTSYILVGQNASRDLKVAVDLERRAAYFYLRLSEANNFAGSSCICSGCKGCNPLHEIENGRTVWFCSSCSSSGKCTKSVIVSF